MNILHMRYAIEVERTRSISKAAENLYMGQPNLSRAIKELEESLGITIFLRTSKGISLTAHGEEFMQYARKIVSQIDDLENMYKVERTNKQIFSVSVPRASYIAAAFTEFTKSLSTENPAEIFYKETNASRAIDNIMQADYRLGIIRYQSIFEQYFRALLHEKGLASEVLQEFSYCALMSKYHPLAAKEEIEPQDFHSFIELAHADPYVPSLPNIDAKKAELSEFVDKRIFVFERGSQMDILSSNPNTFMFVSPIPARILQQHKLVQREIKTKKRYKDVLIYRKGYKFTALDNRFIEEINKHKF